MSTSRYFRGVKLEDPSVTACRNEMLARGQRQREAEAARVAPATVVAAKGRRAQASAAVSERTRPAAAPSLFRALRPSDVIVKPPSRTTTMTTSTPPTPLSIPPEPEPVAAILARRRAAAARMGAWLRGGAPSLDPAARPPEASVAAVPTKRTEPEALADVFARRRATVKAARARSIWGEPWDQRDPGARG